MNRRLCLISIIFIGGGGGSGTFSSILPILKFQLVSAAFALAVARWWRWRRAIGYLLILAKVSTVVPWAILCWTVLKPRWHIVYRVVFEGDGDGDSYGAFQVRVRS